MGLCGEKVGGLAIDTGFEEKVGGEAKKIDEVTSSPSASIVQN